MEVIRQLVDEMSKQFNGPIRFWQINEDCLRVILNMLDFKSLLSIVEACSQTKAIAREIFVKKYSHFKKLHCYVDEESGEYHMNRSTTIDIEESTVEEYRVLRHFGDLIAKVDILYLLGKTSKDNMPLKFNSLVPLISVAEEIFGRTESAYDFPYEKCMHLTKLNTGLYSAANCNRFMETTFDHLTDIRVNHHSMDMDEIMLAKFINNHPSLRKIYLTSQSFSFSYEFHKLDIQTSPFLSLYYVDFSKLCNFFRTCTFLQKQVSYTF